jgi:hypothetical protein
MNEELQPYAPFVYVLVAVSFILTPWAAFLFFQWRTMAKRLWMRAVFTTIPLVMLALFAVRLMVLFKLFETIDIQLGRLHFVLTKTELELVLAYIGAINGIWMLLLFHLATRSVRRAYKHEQAEMEAARLHVRKTSEILGDALKHGERMHAVFTDFLHSSK